MKEKFAEDIRLDEEARIRRLKERDEYKMQIVEQAETKARMYAEEKAAEVEARRKLEEEEAFKARVVEAARQRLLQEHAAALGGFIPKGVLSRPEDLALLSQFDTDGDGSLSRSEVAAAESKFMQYDANNDGTLQEGEKSAAWDDLKAQEGAFA